MSYFRLTNLEMFVETWVLNVFTSDPLIRQLLAKKLRKILDTEFPQFKNLRNLSKDQISEDSKLKNLFRSMFYPILGNSSASGDAFEKELEERIFTIAEELIITYQRDLRNRNYEDEQDLKAREAHKDEVNEIRLQKETGVLDYGQDDYNEDFSN